VSRGRSPGMLLPPWRDANQLMEKGKLGYIGRLLQQKKLKKKE